MHFSQGGTNVTLVELQAAMRATDLFRAVRQGKHADIDTVVDTFAGRSSKESALILEVYNSAYSGEAIQGLIAQLESACLKRELALLQPSM